jgi:hypothetical protein
LLLLEALIGSGQVGVGDPQHVAQLAECAPVLLDPCGRLADAPEADSMP